MVAIVSADQIGDDAGDDVQVHYLSLLSEASYVASMPLSRKLSPSDDAFVFH